MNDRRISIATLVAVLLVGLVAAYGAFRPAAPLQGFGPQGYTNFTQLDVAAPTYQATDEPALVVNSSGVGRILELQDGGTPVVYLDDGGTFTANGGWSTSTGQTFTNWMRVAGPTAVATATPAMVVDSLGVSNILEVRDAATPVFTINNGGAVQQVGARTASGGDTINNWSKVAAPTAIATATPAAVVDSLGVSNILEVRDAATPVFTVQNGGTVVGNVLQYGSAGEQAVAASATFTTTGTVAHGLTTVTWAVCTLAQDADDDAGDTAYISVSISTNVVTVKAWQDDATAATDTDVDVNCLVIGTP